MSQDHPFLHPQAQPTVGSIPSGKPQGVIGRETDSRMGTSRRGRAPSPVGHHPQRLAQPPWLLGEASALPLQAPETAKASGSHKPASGWQRTPNWADATPVCPGSHCSPGGWRIPQSPGAGQGGGRRQEGLTWPSEVWP